MDARGAAAAAAAAAAADDDAAARLAALDPFPDLTEEDIIALLENYERSGMGLGPVPDDLREMVRNVKRGKGQPVEETASEVIHPNPNFVIKTADQSGRKVFINICTHDAVPAPGSWAGGLPPPEIEAAMAAAASDDPAAAAAAAEVLRFPLSVGSLRDDIDKRGEACATVDIVLNTAIAAAAAAQRPFKAFLIDLALDQVGRKHELQLDAKYKLPKMAYKGAAPEAQRVRVEAKRKVTEVEAAAPAAGRAGGGGAAAAAAKAGAGAAAHSGGGGGSSSSSGGGGQRAAGPPRELKHTVEYEGRPVTAVTVTVDLGDNSGTGGTGDVRVSVSGQEVAVSVPGARELVLTLPLAVSAAGAKAEVGPAAGAGAGGAARVLRLRLPHLPVRKWVKQAAASAPPPFEALPVEGAKYMELE